MKDEEEVEQLLKQHLDNYKNAVIEIIKNNTNSLIDEDISSLIKKPPLDSMDAVKNKLLELAKKHSIVLNTNQLELLVGNYRDQLLLEISKLKQLRNKRLMENVDQFSPTRETELISFSTQDTLQIDKLIKSKIKKCIQSCIEKFLLEKLDLVYQENVELKDKEFISQTFLKFMKGNYQKQLMNNIDVKIMVKNRTLISGILEQGERYLFTQSNSHLFDVKPKAIC